MVNLKTNEVILVISVMTKSYIKNKKNGEKRENMKELKNKKYLDNLHFKNYEKVNNIMLR